MSDSVDGPSGGRSLGRTVRWYVTVPFWNRSERRLRAFWRVLVAVVAALAAAIGLASVAGTVSFSTAGFLLQQVPRAVLAVALVVLLALFVDRRPVAAYGLHLDRSWAWDLLAGVAVGTAVHIGAFAVYLGTGWASVDELGYTAGADGPFGIVLIVIAVGFVAVAVWEELIFRGVVITNGAEGLGWLSPRAAVVVASLLAAVVFGVLHLQQAPTAVSLLFWIGMGVILAFAYALTGELAFPIGLHFAYNFVGNSVLGITGVASDRIPTLVRLEFTGPEPFVSVAGVVNGAFVTIAGLATLGWIAWRDSLAIDTDLAVWRGE